MVWTEHEGLREALRRRGVQLDLPRAGLLCRAVSADSSRPPSPGHTGRPESLGPGHPRAPAPLARGLVAGSLGQVRAAPRRWRLGGAPLAAGALAPLHAAGPRGARGAGGAAAPRGAPRLRVPPQLLVRPAPGPAGTAEAPPVLGMDPHRERGRLVRRLGVGLALQRPDVRGPLPPDVRDEVQGRRPVHGGVPQARGPPAPGEARPPGRGLRRLRAGGRPRPRQGGRGRDDRPPGADAPLRRVAQYPVGAGGRCCNAGAGGGRGGGGRDTADLAPHRVYRRRPLLPGEAVPPSRPQGRAPGAAAHRNEPGRARGRGHGLRGGVGDRRAHLPQGRRHGPGGRLRPVAEAGAAEGPGAAPERRRGPAQEQHGTEPPVSVARRPRQKGGGRPAGGPPGGADVAGLLVRLLVLAAAGDRGAAGHGRGGRAGGGRRGCPEAAGQALGRLHGDSDAHDEERCKLGR
mmetsp:Transcript_100244/g.283884  ORF Transcript_100244/g.283884 Transcript_100244/m.283884 type:complete len:460 (+) Transcript_100244:106-1485(+)